MNNKIVEEAKIFVNGETLEEEETLREVTTSKMVNGVKKTTFSTVTIFTLSETKIFNNKYLTAMYYNNDITKLYIKYIGVVKILKSEKLLQYDTTFLKIAIKNSFDGAFVKRFETMLDFKKWDKTNKNVVRFNKHHHIETLEEKEEKMYKDLCRDNIDDIGFDNMLDFLEYYNLMKNELSLNSYRASLFFQKLEEYKKTMYKMAVKTLEEEEKEEKETLEEYLKNELNYNKELNY